ncbi:hypothetical protein FH972_027107 [Carpinus fangiana]|uniref:PGG domain-containing protein n=1 Tax=Carpinus fangiana TaxID=176857 RepID=A0A5N6L8F4_9ROSI|nr:hypothetical protein FH972_027107 [Carpinus fangiana]
MEFQSLRDAAQQGSIDALCASIQEDVKVLDRIDEIPFIETPLHYTVFAGHTRFAMEIVRLKPLFAKKLNQHGFTPIHVALQNNKDQVVLELLDVDENLVRVQEREDITIRKETVLHIALKNNIFDAVELVLGWLRRSWSKNATHWERTLLNRQDEAGNNVLHIAIVRILLKFRLPFHVNKIDINAKNSEGFTAFDMLQGDNKKMKIILRSARRFNIMHYLRVASDHANYFKSPVSIDERLYIYHLRLTTAISNEMRNVLLVVAALLVTVSFQIAVSPPGGVWQDNYIPMTNTSNGAAPNNASGEYLQHPHYAGTAVMGNTFFPALEIQTYRGLSSAKVKGLTQLLHGLDQLMIHVTSCNLF